MLSATTLDAVVIGASAGGVEAITTLLAPLRAPFGVAVVIVIHLPPTNENLLVSVLRPRCALPVVEAADKDSIERGTVYLAPPGYHLLVEPGRTFALSLDAPVHFSRPSIDVLFESAAFAYRDRLLGILLTGANADGADGIARIRAFGGQAWVQDPSTAAAPAMPTAALERAGADRVLSLPEMAGALAAIGAA